MYVPQSFFMKKEILQKKRNLSASFFPVKLNQNIAGCKGSLPKTCVRTTRKTSVYLQRLYRTDFSIFNLILTL